MPPPSEILTSLSLHFSNVLHALAISTSPVVLHNLDSMFPNLEKLRLVGRAKFYEGVLDVLPRRLLHLTLDFPGEIQLSLFVSKLPQLLEELYIRIPTPYKDEAIITWPPKLRRLLVQSSLNSARPFETLPEGLEFFDAMVLSGIIDYPAHLLPRTLTDMDLRIGTHANLDFLQLPQSLKTLTLSACKKLNASTDARMDIASLPQGLTKLHFSMQVLMSENSNLSHLPRTVTFLSLPSFSVQWLKPLDLPPGLTQLHHSSEVYTSEMMKELPRSITSLSTIALESSADLQYLPPKLKTLKLDCTIDASSLRLLPRTLEDVDCTLNDGFQFQDLLDLPSSLKRIILKCHYTAWDGWPTPYEEVFDPSKGESKRQFVAKFHDMFGIGAKDRSDACAEGETRGGGCGGGGGGSSSNNGEGGRLEHINLQLTDEGDWEHFAAWLHDILPGMSALKMLQLSSRTSPLRLTWPADFLLHLPKSLTSLSLPTSKLLEPSHLSKLPTGMRYLSLLGESPGITNEFASLIPRGITHLDMGHCQNIDESCTANLPRNMVSFSVTPKLETVYLPPLSQWKAKSFESFPEMPDE
jgi:hypothetical protein